MGVDALIFFQVKKKYLNTFDDTHDLSFLIYELDENEGPSGATHTLTGLGRYYSETHKNGNWPLLVQPILELMSQEEISRVWYLPDTGENLKKAKPITLDRIFEITKFYVERKC